MVRKEIIHQGRYRHDVMTLRIEFNARLARETAKVMSENPEMKVEDAAKEASKRITEDVLHSVPEEPPEGGTPNEQIVFVQHETERAYRRWSIARVRLDARGVDFATLETWEVEDVLALRGRRMDFAEWVEARFPKDE